MTNLDQRDLDYGQLGNAIYAQERHEWIPQRQPSTNHAITPFNPILHEDSHNAAAQGTALKEPYRSSAIRLAADIHPSLRPAAPYISHFLTERAQDAAPVDVLVGDLLAVVGAKHADRSDRIRGQERNIQRAVLVTRSTAEDEVRFTETTKTRSGWEGDDSTYLESNTILHESWTSWKSGGDAVLQVCCPDVSDGDELPEVLAVRLPTSVQLFRPKYARSLVKPRRRSGEKTHSTSRIDPDPTELLHMPEDPGVDVPSTRSSHISFNPFSQSEIALIASSGMWTVYRTESYRTKMLQKAHMATQGTVSGLKRHSDYIQDGWHRIIWCIDSYHILVCNRQQLQLHEKAHFGSGKCLATWHAFTNKSSDCIVDLRRSTVNHEHVFLLTTKSISLIRVQDSSASTGIEVLCSWRHYRDPSDVCLRLSIIPYLDNVSILLYSSTGPLVTQYRCSRLRIGELISSDLSPFRVSLAVAGLRGIAVLPIPLVRQVSSSLLDQHREDKASYLQILALTDELGTEAHMCYALLGPQTDDHAGTMVPTWSRPVKTRSTLSSDIIEDDFVIPDDQDSEGYQGSGDDDDDDIERAGQASALASKLIDDNFLVPYDDVYEALLTHGPHRDEMDLEQLLQNITTQDDEVLHLLEERRGHSYRIQGIDTLSRAAADMMEATADLTSSNSNTVLARLAPLENLGLSAMAIPDASLSTIYSKLASHWLRPLPANTPTRSRIAKEKVVRQVAASIFLTSHCVTLKHVPNPAGPTEPPRSSNQTEVMDTQDSQSHPTSSPPASPKPPKRPNLASLKRYATIVHPPDTPSAPIFKILSHWSLNSDPSEYDYTSKVAAADAPDPEANISEIERKKLRRKEDRKRQRTESDHRKRAKVESMFKPYQPSQQTQSQVFGPEAPRSTSAARQDVGHAQSQLLEAAPESLFQVSSQVGPASQMPPGKFGGRLAFRGKRKAGF